MKVLEIRKGDPKCIALLHALIDVVEERGQGMSAPSIIGVVDLLKDYVKHETDLEQ